MVKFNNIPIYKVVVCNVPIDYINYKGILITVADYTHRTFSIQLSYKPNYFEGFVQWTSGAYDNPNDLYISISTDKGGVHRILLKKEDPYAYFKYDFYESATEPLTGIWIYANGTYKDLGYIISGETLNLNSDVTWERSNMQV